REQALAFLAFAAGLHFEGGSGAHPEEAAFGDMCLAVAGKKRSGLLTWDDPAELWKAFTEGSLPSLPRKGRSTPTPPGLSTNAAVAVEVTLPPNGEATVPFFLTWHFPNYYFQGTRIPN